MKKPKDVADLASRLASAASAPLIPPAESPTPAPHMQPVAVAVTPVRAEAVPVKIARTRRKPQRSSVSVFLRLSQPLFERYDQEAVRRTKETGRGVTVQQVILDRLAEKGA